MNLSNKIKVLYIHHTTALGGATNSMLFTIQNLPKDQFQSKVLFLDKEGPASDLFKNNNIEIDHLFGITHFQHAENGKIKWIGRIPLKPIFQFIKMLKSVGSIAEYLLNQKVDIIHINTSVMLAVGLACKKIKQNVVWHVREPISKGVFGVRRYIVTKIISKCANQIIAISKQDLKAIGDPKNGNVVYNFLNFEKFNSETVQDKLHQELNLPPNTKIILMLGGVVHSKGADVLIESIPQIINHNSNIHFVIVGYPPNQPNQKNQRFNWNRSMSDKCINLISKYKIDKYITFLGLRNDIPELLISSNILVWPATVPHFSRPIIEAQAMGIPTIGTNFKVTKEVIVDEETGLTFVNGNSKDLAKKINQLLNDKVLYKKISFQAYQEAKNRFNADINIKKVVSIYHSIYKETSV